MSSTIDTPVCERRCDNLVALNLSALRLYSLDVIREAVSGIDNTRVQQITNLCYRLCV